MDLSELELKGFIRKLPVDRKKVKETFELARRDLHTAKEVIMIGHFQ